VPGRGGSYGRPNALLDAKRRVMARPVLLTEETGHSHLVEFYETDEFLVDTVSDFIGSSLRDGDAAIVIATAAHRRAFETALNASGIELAAAVDRYLALDAAEMLEKLMVSGAPDVGRFRDTIGVLIEHAAADGRQVRIFGEMVALLWSAGDLASTIAFEDLWNDREGSHQLARLCAYPLEAFNDEASAEAFESICERHTTVIPSDSYPLRGTADVQQRAVARLQHNCSAAIATVAQLRAEREIMDALARSDALTGLAKSRLSHQLDTAEQVADLGTWEWFPREGTMVWSDNLYRIFGLEPGEITPTTDYLLERTYPEDREQTARFVELIALSSRPPPIEYRIQRLGGEVRYIRSTITNIDPGSRGARHIVGMVQDVTDQRIASRELAAHIAVSAALIDWSTFEDGAMRLLNDLGTACEVMVGALWLPHDDVLSAELMWSDPTLHEISGFESMTFALRLPRGASLPGLAWQSKRPETIVDVSHEPSFRRHEVARAAGLHGAVAFPALKADEVLAVLEFYSREQDHTSGLTQTLTAIGSELGEFFSRRRGELAPPQLTPRELQILQLAALGNAAPQIAESLLIGVSTVKTHMDNIYRKLEVSDRASAVATAMRLGVIH
jgi:DNA-binding CsgD family transcriptional regulator/PAS domain-containing protein